MGRETDRSRKIRTVGAIRSVQMANGLRQRTTAHSLSDEELIERLQAKQAELNTMKMNDALEVRARNHLSPRV